MESSAVLRRAIDCAPQTPGVYEMCDASGKVLYVGKAKNIRKRLVAYTRVRQLPLRLQRMVAALDSVRFTSTCTEIEALLLEHNLIKKHQPPCNVLLKDGQSFVYIALTKHPFPQLLRQRGRRSDVRMFGPYPSSTFANETIRVLQRVFMLRTCSDHEFSNRVRPCLHFDMKRCTAPCVGRITAEEYGRIIRQATLFFQGKSHTVRAQLVEQMEAASAAWRFEEAAQVRDRLEALSAIQSKQHIMVDALDDADVLALHGHRVRVLSYRKHHLVGGHTHVLQHATESASYNMSVFMQYFYCENRPPPLVLVNVAPDHWEAVRTVLPRSRIEQPKRGARRHIMDYACSSLYQHAHSLNEREALRCFAQLVGATRIQRLEVYDNSHLQGTHAVGVMIVVTAHSGLDPSLKRTFHLPSQVHDDTQLMQYTLRQRFETSESHPDWMIVDGGLGQIHAAESVLRALQLNIPVLGLVKHATRQDGLERLMRGDGYVYNLDSNAPLWRVLLQWRDAAHRGAVGQHRIKRSQKAVQSVLDAVEGVGARRKKALLQHFGSVRGIMSAALSDLRSVNGIHNALARRIYDFFHKP